MSNAPQRKPGEANPIVQLAILVGILVVVLNAGFFFLSDQYFEDRALRFGVQELARIGRARIDFAIFSIVVGAATVLAAMYPRAVGHGVAAAGGLASLVAMPFAFEVGLVLPFTLLLVAGLFALLIRYSLLGSRAAWASLASLCVVSGVVMLFAAPKIRGMVGIGMWLALIAPGLLGVATAALAMIRRDYREAA